MPNIGNKKRSKRKVILTENKHKYANKYLNNKNDTIPTTIRFIKILNSLLEENEILNAILIGNEQKSKLELTIDYFQEGEEVRENSLSIASKIEQLAMIFEYKCTVAHKLLVSKFIIVEDLNQTLLNKAEIQKDKKKNIRSSKKFMTRVYFVFIIVITLLFFLSR